MNNVGKALDFLKSKDMKLVGMHAEGDYIVLFVCLFVYLIYLFTYRYRRR